MPDFGKYETCQEGTPWVETSHRILAAILTTFTPLSRLQSPVFPSECGIAINHSGSENAQLSSDNAVRASVEAGGQLNAQELRTFVSRGMVDGIIQAYGGVLGGKGEFRTVVLMAEVGDSDPLRPTATARAEQRS